MPTITIRTIPLSRLDPGYLERYRRLMDSIRDERARIEGRIAEPKIGWLSGVTRHTPDSETMTMERKLESLLQEIYDEVKAKWIPKQTFGKLDISRIMQMKAQSGAIISTDLYQQYQTSALDEIRMAVVIVLDKSGSMNESAGGGGNTRGYYAKNACWAISQAFEQKGNNPVAIILFSSDTPVLAKKFGKSGNWGFTNDGGTDPREALDIAVKMLRYIGSQEQIQNLFLVYITDGELNDSPPSGIGPVQRDVIKLFKKIKGSRPSMDIKIIEMHVEVVAPFCGADFQLYFKDFRQFPIEFTKVMKNIQLDIYRKLRR